ncbi:MAG TPA: serine hydrolase, partial [Bacteroidales bacterium]|nr:serine hydrolase [Bacteroidales bacterium]
MKKFTLLSFLFVFFISFQLLAQKKQAGLDLKKLDEYIAKAQTDWNIPAVAVAVVKDGKVLFAKGYGTRNLSLKTAADENTLFAIASNSKAFTTTGLALMVDKGKLKWDDKVIKHLPWFESYDPYVTANMTVRDLITHRSGLGTFSGDVLWYHTNYSAKEVVRRAKYLTPAKGFREGFGYQNIMFTAAGLVLEEVSGMSWGEFMKQNFLDPLEMKNSNYSVKQLDMAGNVAVPYQTEFDNSHTALNYLNWDNCAPAAAINSSVADMAKWMIFQLNNGKIADKQVVS